MKLLLALAAVAALLLAGCNGGSDGGSTPETDGQGRYVIHMTANNRFTPADAKVPVGATVVWVNDGGVHDVTAHDDAWKSPRLMPEGASYERRFTTPGTYEYHCDLHASQGMTATLVVEGDGPVDGGTTVSGSVSASVSGTSTGSGTGTTSGTGTSSA